jgi:NAD(P)-dependent dehydrogenase (short-subunit alcohol dehydrogenase family)
MQHRGPLEHFDPEMFELLMRTNVSGAFNVGQAVARHMIARGRGNTDVLVTADKVFVDIVEECRPYAPCQLPACRLVPAGAIGVGMVLDFLVDHPRLLADYRHAACGQTCRMT